MKPTKQAKPVKAWGVKLPSGKLQAEAWPDKHYAVCAARSTPHVKGKEAHATRVTMSVDDPLANRISAAQRRVVEAAVEWVKPPLWSGDATKAGLKLASAVDALQRAKGGANG